MTYLHARKWKQLEQNGEILKAALLLFEEIEINYENAIKNPSCHPEQEALLMQYYYKIAYKKSFLEKRPRKVTQIMSELKDVRTHIRKIIQNIK